MEKIFKSKLFPLLTPAVTLVLSMLAGVFLGYQPRVTGSTYGYISSVTGGRVEGATQTLYEFSLTRALGIWLIGIAVSLSVFLLSVLIQKLYTKDASAE